MNPANNNPANDSALIELAYAASFVTLFDNSNRAWDQPVGDVVPADIEKECYRLTNQLGLKPMVDAKNLQVLLSVWRRQLRQERQREIFDMGTQLVRQHGLMSFLQCHPNAPERPEICFLLDQIRESLTRFFIRFELKESIAKLPDLPLPNSPDTWMTWSGDVLRDKILDELGVPE